MNTRRTKFGRTGPGASKEPGVDAGTEVLIPTISLRGSLETEVRMVSGRSGSKPLTCNS